MQDILQLDLTDSVQSGEVILRTEVCRRRSTEPDLKRRRGKVHLRHKDGKCTDTQTETVRICSSAKCEDTQTSIVRFLWFSSHLVVVKTSSVVTCRMTLSGWLKLDELVRAFPLLPGVEGHRPSNFLPHVRTLQTHTGCSATHTHTSCCSTTILHCMEQMKLFPTLIIFAALVF